jgi:hypothetical protein
MGRLRTQAIKSLLAILTLGFLTTNGCGLRSAGSPEQMIATQIQNALDSDLQQVFNRIHPVGTAKSAQVHDVAILWKRGVPSKRLDDVQTFTVRYTLYWEGPVTKDGYTKISETYDAEIGRYTAGRILATNGITNRDASEAALDVGAAILHNLIHGND